MRTTLQRRPSVTLAIAKRKGANAVTVADDILKRLEIVKGRIVPEDLQISVTRNYGATATEKANELLFHLGLATISIVALITVAIGWREGFVVLIVIPTTILLTLFASWLMGYTTNRVSLFALIFSIGILVDDAIVVVENISRHWAMSDGRSLTTAAIEAVAEVGNPTIVATLTIVAALSADDVRERNDGAVHEPDPGERVDRDAVFVLCRGDGHAVAPSALCPRQVPRSPDPRNEERAASRRGRRRRKSPFLSHLSLPDMGKRWENNGRNISKSG